MKQSHQFPIAAAVLVFVGSIALASTLVPTKRSPTQAANFRAANPCPGTGKIQKWCKGYVVDHVIPLCAGGTDAPSNMQWQEKEASYEKDKLERAECAKLHSPIRASSIPAH